jgi:hypothetical protein
VFCRQQPVGAGREPPGSHVVPDLDAETGVDSIALTYGLLGPVMAIVRPIAAILSAAVAGMLAIVVRDDGQRADDAFGAAVAANSEVPAHSHGLDAVPEPDRSVRERGESVLRYGFGSLVDELAFWLLFGIALTGVLGALLPNDFFSRVLGWDRGLVPMLAMVVVGIPLYLCASASTPVATALIAKGLSPGAALVFLLTGRYPAATIAVVSQLSPAVACGFDHRRRSQPGCCSTRSRSRARVSDRAPRRRQWFPRSWNQRGVRVPRARRRFRRTLPREASAISLGMRATCDLFPPLPTARSRMPACAGVARCRAARLRDGGGADRGARRAASMGAFPY